MLFTLLLSFYVENMFHLRRLFFINANRPLIIECIKYLLNMHTK